MVVTFGGTALATEFINLVSSEANEISTNINNRQFVVVIFNQRLKFCFIVLGSFRIIFGEFISYKQDVNQKNDYQAHPISS